jgi:hypothetical protein
VVLVDRVVVERIPALEAVLEILPVLARLKEITVVLVRVGLHFTVAGVVALVLLGVPLVVLV